LAPDRKGESRIRGANEREPNNEQNLIHFHVLQFDDDRGPNEVLL
jgi:hypothetical protein